MDRRADDALKADEAGASERRAEKYVPPEATVADLGVGTAKAMVEAVPLVGGVASAWIFHAIDTPLGRRQQEFFESIAAGLMAAEIKIEELGKRQDLLDTFVAATRIAVGTSSERKRRALRNAVLNTAIRPNDDETERHLFVGFVERFSEFHLILLKTLQDPVNAANALGLDTSERTNATITAVVGRGVSGDTFKAVWNDLYQSLLVMGGGDYISTPIWNVAKRGPTALGERFLAFIEDPQG